MVTTLKLASNILYKGFQITNITMKDDGTYKVKGTHTVDYMVNEVFFYRDKKKHLEKIRTSFGSLVVSKSVKVLGTSPGQYDIGTMVTVVAEVIAPEADVVKMLDFENKFRADTETVKETVEPLIKQLEKELMKQTRIKSELRNRKMIIM